MKKILLLLAVLTVFLYGCEGENSTDHYEEGRMAGYEAGYEEGLAAGRAEVYTELAEGGVLRKTELVWLSKDRTEVYHSFYCELADREQEVLKEHVVNGGYSPCSRCGGEGRSVYVPN